MSGVVNGLAAFGRFEATVYLVFLACIGLSCFASGFASLKSSDPKQKGESFQYFIGGLCLILTGYLFYSFAQSSRTGAAVMGGVGGAQIGSSLLFNNN
jgi:hypothetical protein